MDIVEDCKQSLEALQDFIEDEETNQIANGKTEDNNSHSFTMFDDVSIEPLVVKQEKERRTLHGEIRRITDKVKKSVDGLDQDSSFKKEAARNTALECGHLIGVFITNELKEIAEIEFFTRGYQEGGKLLTAEITYMMKQLNITKVENEKYIKDKEKRLQQWDEYVVQIFPYCWIENGEQILLDVQARKEREEKLKANKG
jgi:hypothetical protein